MSLATDDEDEFVPMGHAVCVELKSRNKGYVVLSKIAAIIELKETGPTRLIFDGGGSMDVCGPAATWTYRVITDKRALR